MPSTQKPCAAYWASAGMIMSRTPQFLSARTTTSNDNNPQTTPRCLQTHNAVYNSPPKPSTFWPPPHLHHGAAEEDTHHSWVDQIIKDTQMSLSDAVTATHDRPSWRSLVRDATCPASQVSKQYAHGTMQNYCYQSGMINKTCGL